MQQPVFVNIRRRIPVVAMPGIINHAIFPRISAFIVFQTAKDTHAQ